MKKTFWKRTKCPLDFTAQRCKMEQIVSIMDIKDSAGKMICIIRVHWPEKKILGSVSQHIYHIHSAYCCLLYEQFVKVYAHCYVYYWNYNWFMIFSVCGLITLVRFKCLTPLLNYTLLSQFCRTTSPQMTKFGIFASELSSFSVVFNFSIKL